MEDVLLAGLLYFICSSPDNNLSNVRYNTSLLKSELITFLSDEDSVLCFTYQEETRPFCKTNHEEVPLYCLCKSPWIEGTTSKAIYGKIQKEFNSHACAKCSNWFHKYCLRICGITPPKRTHDFICQDCRIPSTIPWSHPLYVNTCTSDNILTIILLHCKQCNGFLEKLGTSTIEKVLKTGIKEMLDGNFQNGKTIILDYLRSVITLDKCGNSFNCFGSEYSHCLILFRHIWKLSMSLKCNSPYCPNPLTSRYPTSFSVNPNDSISVRDQLSSCFPLQGDPSGYCGQEFHEDIPENAEYGYNERTNAITNEIEPFFECRGTPIVQQAGFLSRLPWMIPIHINLFKPDKIMELVEALPHQICVYGCNYKLAGYSLHRDNHFTAVVFWRDSQFYYDGLGHTDELRFQAIPTSDFNGKEGSFAIYLLF